MTDATGAQAIQAPPSGAKMSTGRIEAEVQVVLTRAFDSAVDTLSRRRAVLDGMAEALLAQGSLEREEFLALLGEAA